MTLSVASAPSIGYNDMELTLLRNKSRAVRSLPLVMVLHASARAEVWKLEYSSTNH